MALTWMPHRRSELSLRRTMQSVTVETLLPTLSWTPLLSSGAYVLVGRRLTRPSRIRLEDARYPQANESC